MLVGFLSFARYLLTSVIHQSMVWSRVRPVLMLVEILVCWDYFGDSMFEELLLCLWAALRPLKLVVVALEC
jgi:hypothetical protein